MKRTLAIILALATMASMSSMALAATVSSEEVEANSMTTRFDSGDYVYYENNDGDMEAHSLSSDSITVNPGKTVYIPLRDSTTGHYIGSESKDEAKKVKVYTSWTVGKTDTPDIVYKKLPLEGGSETYVYAVAINMPTGNNTSTYDLCGTISTGKTKSTAESDNCTSVNFEVKYGIAYADTEDYPSTGELGTDYASFDGDVDEDFPVVDFGDGESDEEITWGDEELATFTVDTTSQSRLNLDWSTKYNSEFASNYSYANIDFLTFTKTPSFNKTGELLIYADPDTYIYEVGSDGYAKELKNATYDEDEEAFVIRTRTLSSYAISDAELKTTTTSSSEDSSDSSTTEEAPTEESSTPDTDTTKPNPDTGR